MIPTSPHYESRLNLFAYEKGREVDVLFLGDSLIERFEVERFFPDLKCANRGIDGDTTARLLDRLVSSCNVEEPKFIILLIGVNNLANATDDYPYILAKLRKIYAKSRLFVISLLPLGGIHSDGNKEVDICNEKLEAIVKTHREEYVNVHDYLLDQDGELKEEFTVDGVHLSELGYQVFADILLPLLDD